MDPNQTEKNRRFRDTEQLSKELLPHYVAEFEDYTEKQNQAQLKKIQRMIRHHNKREVTPGAFGNNKGNLRDYSMDEHYNSTQLKVV